MTLAATGLDATLLARLAIPHRAKSAFHALMDAGEAAMPLARQGLDHPNAAVRYYCAQYFDHFMSERDMADMAHLLDDPSAGVRSATLHTLSCDRCKGDMQLPYDGPILEKGIALMRTDPSAHVRAMAVGLVGRSVHAVPRAAEALLATQASDPSPAVRKKAGWYVPGGPIFRRTAPKRPRARG